MALVEVDGRQGFIIEPPVVDADALGAAEVIGEAFVMPLEPSVDETIYFLGPKAPSPTTTSWYASRTVSEEDGSITYAAEVRVKDGSLTATGNGWVAVHNMLDPETESGYDPDASTAMIAYHDWLPAYGTFNYYDVPAAERYMNGGSASGQRPPVMELTEFVPKNGEVTVRPTVPSGNLDGDATYTVSRDPNRLQLVRYGKQKDDGDQLGFRSASVLDVPGDLRAIAGILVRDELRYLGRGEAPVELNRDNEAGFAPTSDEILPSAGTVFNLRLYAPARMTTITEAF